MRKLGRPLHTVKRRVVIVEMEERKPIIGASVYDYNLRLVGKIVDIIGPVKKPYAVVRPLEKKFLESMASSPKLYYETRPRRFLPKRRRRGR